MKQKQVVKISVFITSIFILFLSITYAFMDMTLAGLKRQVITAGNYELEIDEDENNLTIQNALPMYDEVGMLQDPFTFRLINKDDESLSYELFLKDITTGDKLNPSIVKYQFTKGEDSIIDLLSNLSGNKLDGGYIAPNRTIEYSLRLWIDSEVEDNSLIYGKSLSYKVIASISEDSRLSGMMKPSEFSGINTYWPQFPANAEYYWPYANQITSIIFENDISIPDNIDKKWDISLKEDRSVMAYLENTGEETVKSFENGSDDATEQTISGYRLHIQGEKIYVNEDGNNMFAFLSNLKTIQNLDLLDTSHVSNMRGMFAGDVNLLSLDLSHFDTSNVTDMSSMFAGSWHGCRSLTSLDLSHFDTSNVTDMSSMFQNCKNLKQLIVSSFNTSNVVDMSNMFYGCQRLTSLNVSNFNTSNVTDMSSMFYYCSSLTNLNVSNFNTSNVTDMSSMFSWCSGLTSLNLNNFNTSKTRRMNNMFYYCSNLATLNFTNSDTSNVTDMSYMFGYCGKLKNLNLGIFNTSKLGTGPNDTLGGSLWVFGAFTDYVPYNCKITVKNQASKTAIMGLSSNYTNITVTG